MTTSIYNPYIRSLRTPHCPIETRFTNFLIKSFDVHGTKYDYSNVDYTGNKINVEIICQVHGSFWQTPSTHLSGAGCKMCSIDKISSETADRKRESRFNKFLNDANKKHRNKYIYGMDYINAYTKINIVCQRHGEFKQTPSNHLQGRGCPKCAVELRKTKYAMKLSVPRKDDKDICYRYIIKLSNETEEFYKVGISREINQRISRLSRDTKYAYDISIVNLIVDTRETCLRLEKIILNKAISRRTLYSPLIKFSGYTECYL